MKNCAHVPFSLCIPTINYVGWRVEVLGLENNPVLRVAIGSVADIKDVYCYAVGCILLGVFEFIRWKKNKGTQKE